MQQHGMYRRDDYERLGIVMVSRMGVCIINEGWGLGPEKEESC